MPKKLNFLGGQQNYNPENGQYEPALKGANGESPAEFQKFKKQKSEFEKNNDKRIGKNKKLKKAFKDVSNEDIVEALADAEWTITDETTVEDYANTIAKQLNADPDKVIAAIKKDSPNITPEMKMAEVVDNFGKEENKLDKKQNQFDHIKADHDAIMADPSIYLDETQINQIKTIGKAFNHPYTVVMDTVATYMANGQDADKAIDSAWHNIQKSSEVFGKPEKEEELDVDGYNAELEKQFYNTTIKANNYEVAKQQYESLKTIFGESSGATKGIKKALDEMSKNFDKSDNKVKNIQPKSKDIDSYTDKLFKELNVKTFTSKKYKNPNGEIVEIRRFGDGQNAIRYNETKDEVEQVWLNGERIK